MKKKVIVILLLTIAAGAAYGYKHFYKKEQIDGQLELYGNVDIRKVNLGFRVGGRITEISVEEGDRVKKGQVIARLDATPYQDELRVAEAQLAQAKAMVEKMETGTRPQEIAQAEALVRERQVTVKNLLTEYQRVQKLIDRKAVSQQAFDNADAALAEARARLATAKEGLNLAKEGFREEDKAAARADLQAAEAKVASAQTRLTDTELLASQDGTILTRVEEPGAIVASGGTVLTLSFDSPIWIRAYVDEENLGLVSPGMKAQIVTDGAPDHPYSGQIGFISSEAEFTPKSVQTEKLRTQLVFQLRIIADNPDRGLRQGMPVTVHLLENDALKEH